MHAKFTWVSWVQKTNMVYIVQNQNETAAERKITTKEKRIEMEKSVFYLAKWTDFIPDNLFLYYYYNKCISLLDQIKQPI